MKEFVDVVEFEIEGGHGGAGGISFRKEPYVPQGGPDGGNGGNGGNVIIIVDPRVTTFGAIKSKKRFAAKNGGKGEARLSDGKKGEDIIIRVPLGTVVYDADDNQMFADMTKEGEEFIAAKGGKGGKGNKFYATATNQAPDYAQHGLEGEKKNIRLEIKLIADVGFVGFPNAGKSSMLGRLTRANPKIAPYPFTTLTPNLGVCYLDAERHFILADIPGIIEGANEGAGLGLMFLRHIERTKITAYIIDISGEDPYGDYKKLYEELAKYSKDLVKKTSFIVLNKTDMIEEDEVKKKVKSFERGIKKDKIKNVSAVFSLSVLSSADEEMKPVVEAFYKTVAEDKKDENIINKKEETTFKSDKKYIFGPVHSRRLGLSLGVDVIPRKTCTYNCVYCNLGKEENTTTKMTSAASIDMAIFELKKYLHKYPDINYITISGSGEPTLYSKIKELIAEIKETTNISVCIITNSSMLYKQEIRSAILKADLIIPSLDAGCEETFKKINQPNKEITFDKMTEGLIEFSRVYKGEIWLEVFVMKGINDNDEEMKGINEIIQKMKHVEKIQILTANRVVAYKEYKPAEYEKLVSISKCIKGAVEIHVDINRKKYGENKVVTKDDVYSLLAIHPTDKDGIISGLQASEKEVEKILNALIKDKTVEKVMLGEKETYKIKE